MPTRRDFLRSSLVTAAACASAGLRANPAPAAAPRPLFTGIGITAPLARATEMKECGADFIVPSVADFLMPAESETAFLAQRELAAAAALPVRGCNSFLRDRRLRCTGPDADHPRVLAFAETAFRRLREVGGEYIVFGSNTSRQIPVGYPKEKADEQFVALLRAMGPLAAEHRIVVALEAQQASECNYLNYIREAAAVVASTSHPNIRLLADMFHMARMGDTAQDLERVVSWVSTVELAEKENRTLPGVAGDDFRPYLAVLANAGFSGPACIEGSGTRPQLERAFATVRQQAASVMSHRRD